VSSVSLLFPHQLFWPHPALAPERGVLVIEEFLFFRALPFHQKKLVFHRASMQAYVAALREAGFRAEVVECLQPHADCRHLPAWLKRQGVQEVFVCEPDDDWLLRRLKKGCKAEGIRLHLVPSPAFLNQPEEGDAYFAGRKRYFQTDFYVAQRRQRGLLLESGQPLGGRWSFDTENRQRLPKGMPVPEFRISTETPWLAEAREYVAALFPNNPGDTNPPFDKTAGFYPVTHDQAELWLRQFLEERFAGFGPYEDALVPKEPLLFHSGLSPLLNTGLLTPQQVVDAALDHADRHPVPLPSLEGFLRQILGWREFIRIVYRREGRRQRTLHFWGFTRRIPRAFWTGTTGIVPVDTVIGKVRNNAYAHHIERLMVLGNFFLLCEFDPDEVYAWFMALFIDAYDWVMVPNVYGMTQFADGGLMTTKPYISGSAYLMKMGSWPKGHWQAVWDGLFWRFLQRQRAFFGQNPRLGMLLKTWDNMAPEKQAAHLRVAEAFLKQIDQWNEEESHCQGEPSR